MTLTVNNNLVTCVGRSLSQLSEIQNNYGNNNSVASFVINTGYFKRVKAVKYLRFKSNAVHFWERYMFGQMIPLLGTNFMLC